MAYWSSRSTPPPFTRDFRDNLGIKKIAWMLIGNRKRWRKPFERFNVINVHANICQVDTVRILFRSISCDSSEVDAILQWFRIRTRRWFRHNYTVSALYAIGVKVVPTLCIDYQSFIVFALLSVRIISAPADITGVARFPRAAMRRQYYTHNWTTEKTLYII